MKITAEFNSPEELIGVLTQLQTFFRQDVIDARAIEDMAKRLGTSSDALAAALRNAPTPPQPTGAS